MSAQSTPAWPMIRTLVGIGMLCGLLIAVVFLGTQPHILEQRAAALEQAVFSLLPGAVLQRRFVLTGSGELDGTTDAAGAPLYAGYDSDGKLVGVAIPAAGMGYADTISILYGYRLAEQQIVGLKVLASKETPGLGDKIETDAAFQRNFEALDVRLGTDGKTLLNRIESVKAGAKNEPWQVDSITGATVSSKAIADMLAVSTEEWLPLLRQNRHLLEESLAQ